MFGAALRKHIREFRRYVLNNQYEKGDGGIYFPKAHAFLGGVYTHNVNGEDEQSDHNVIPNEGLNHFLDVVLKGGTPITTWYVMIHSGTGTPDSTTTASNYNSQLTEITSGYSESTRVTWAGDAIDTSNTEVVNDTTPATFTIVTGTTLDVNGAGLVSVSTKGASSGTLLSAGKFAATRTLSNGDEFNLKYKVDLDAA